MLTAIGRQIGIAVENANLYEELRQKEVLRGQLLAACRRGGLGFPSTGQVSRFS
jgi:GAF domain-containing protein